MGLEKQNEILKQLRMTKGGGQGLSAGEPGDVKDAAKGFGSMVVEYLTERLEQPDAGRADLLKTLVGAIYNGSEVSDNTPASNIHLSDRRREMLQQKFIARLYYRGMQDREDGILQAHEKTFQWVFEDSGHVSVPWSDLKEWLASGNAMYWITGKAGSGKSTLMRYISQPIPNPGKEETMAILPSRMTHQPRCAQYLKKWAGVGMPLIMASFYFWAAGSSKTQTSQAGLFRSILYQLLKASPESIPVIAPSRWEALSLFNEDPRDFTEGELGETLCRAVKHIAATSKVALFVDGLDEFEGNPETLIAILRRLTSSSPIKMCVSSRPWAEFEDEFGSKPSLRLEDLTQSDIKNYVAAKFHENAYFAQLQLRQAKVADQLIGSIVDKASGVFLWVQLVVASLLEGLRNGDRVEDLTRRLALLPVELEDLYGKILDQIDPLYREHASQYFQLMRSCTEPPSLLLFSFADEVAFTDFALNLNRGTLSNKEVMARLDDMRRRLNSRCKGLLEVNNASRRMMGRLFDAGGTVQYLHKTVMEYLERPNVREDLDSHLQTSYDPKVRLLAATVAEIRLSRAIGPGHPHSGNDIVLRCMDYAASSHSSHSKDVVQLLDGLRQVMGLSSFPTSQVVIDELTNRVGGVIGADDRFLCFAAENMVLEYINAKADWGCCLTLIRSQTMRRGLLQSWIVKLGTVQRKPLSCSLLSLLDLHRPLSPAMFRMLLNKGAEPNFRQSTISRDFVPWPTPWQTVLARIIFAFSSDASLSEEELSNVSDCARVMVDHGAKISRDTVRKASEEGMAWSGFVPLRYSGQGRVIIDRVYQALKHMKADRQASLAIDYEYMVRRQYGRLAVEK